MRKKVLAVVSALVITTLAFTGCGGNKSASSDNGSDSGAKSQAITVVSREEGSGTRGAFVELLGVVDENENDITVSSAQITNSTSVMLQKVAQTKSAIGYVSLGSLSTDVKAVQVDGADATAENVKSGNYKVSRPFNICYKEDKLSDIDKDFISFIMSKEGQQIVNDNGYIGVEATESYKARKSCADFSASAFNFIYSSAVSGAFSLSKSTSESASQIASSETFSSMMTISMLVTAFLPHHLR